LLPQNWLMKRLVLLSMIGCVAFVGFRTVQYALHVQPAIEKDCCKAATAKPCPAVKQQEECHTNQDLPLSPAPLYF
jgi:hypothetical protein